MATIDTAAQRAIAEEVLGPVRWQEDGQTGFCTCPGAGSHTNKNGRKDCKVWVGEGAPWIKCLHSSCAADVAEKRHQLQSLIGKAEARLNGGQAPGRPRPTAQAAPAAFHVRRERIASRTLRTLTANSLYREVSPLLSPARLSGEVSEVSEKEKKKAEKAPKVETTSKQVSEVSEPKPAKDAPAGRQVRARIVADLPPKGPGLPMLTLIRSRDDASFRVHDTGPEWHLQPVPKRNARR